MKFIHLSSEEEFNFSDFKMFTIKILNFSELNILKRIIMKFLFIQNSLNH